MNQTVLKPARPPCRSASGDVCKNKRMGCHTECPEYKIFRAQMDRFNEEQFRIREFESAITAQLKRSCHEK